MAPEGTTTQPTIALQRVRRVERHGRLAGGDREGAARLGELPLAREPELVAALGKPADPELHRPVAGGVLLEQVELARSPGSRRTWRPSARARCAAGAAREVADAEERARGDRPPPRARCSGSGAGTGSRARREAPARARARAGARAAGRPARAARGRARAARARRARAPSPTMSFRSVIRARPPARPRGDRAPRAFAS